MSLYTNIKAVCKEKGVTIARLEQDLGLSKGAVCKWDTNVPSIVKVSQVATYLGVPIDALVDAKNSAHI